MLATRAGATGVCPAYRSPRAARLGATVVVLACTCVARRRAQRRGGNGARSANRRAATERALFDGHNSSSRLLAPRGARAVRVLPVPLQDPVRPEARLLQAELEASLGRRCFLDSDDLKDLRQLADHVRASDVLVLIQSSDVLSRPWCLLELLTAIDAGVPSSASRSRRAGGVRLPRGGGAHGRARRARAPRASAAQLLDEHGHTLEDAAEALSVLPQVISVPLDPFASRAVLAATVHDTVEAMRAARRGQLPDKAEWLRSRERPRRCTARRRRPASASASVPARCRRCPTAWPRASPRAARARRC